MSEKTVSEKMMDLARAIDAIDWSRLLLRVAFEEYNRRMAEVNGRR